MKKTIFAGEGICDREKVKCYIEVSIEKNSENQNRLSICGEIKTPGGRFISCDQCIDTIAKIVPSDKNKRICEVWKRWHLNDMHAGCIHQREFENEPYEKHMDSVCPICDYNLDHDELY